MTVLLIRPLNLALVTQRALLQLGKESIIIPFLEIKSHNEKIIDKKYDAVIITSQNATSTILQSPLIKSKTIFAVGNKTKAKLIDKGCSNRIITAPTASDLENSIIRSMKSHSKLLYIAGEHLSYDLDIKLKKLGHTVEKIVIYTAAAKEFLSEEECHKINSYVETILFYSTRTASIFAKLALIYKLNLNGKIALCISENCKSVITMLPWSKIKIANQPNETELFKLL
jgi:uroporphyrinogen-III synthase